MLNLTALTVLIIGLVLFVVFSVAALAYQTAHRLDRLHVRVDLSRQALDAALARRSAVARAVAATLPADRGRALRAAADRAENAADEDREPYESRLSAALSAIDVESLPRTLVAEIADADTRVTMARRFHNDAVRDTRVLRGRRFVRWLHLGGTAPMPRYFDIVDRGGVLPPALLSRTEGRRVSARVLVLDPDGAVLLIRGHDPKDESAHFWFPVGGAVEPGESLLDAAVREIHEETGIAVSAGDLVGPLYRRESVFSFNGEVIDSEDHYYAITVDRFAPQPVGLTDVEQRYFDGTRWLTGAEIGELDDPVYPVSLAALLPDVRAALASRTVPAAPVSID